MLQCQLGLNPHHLNAAAETHFTHILASLLRLKGVWIAAEGLRLYSDPDRRTMWTKEAAGGAWQGTEPRRTMAASSSPSFQTARAGKEIGKPG